MSSLYITVSSMGLARLSIYETRDRDRTAPATSIKKGGARETGAERERTKIEETRRGRFTRRPRAADQESMEDNVASRSELMFH